MYLLYIDHSGEISDSTEDYFVMAGAAIFERQVYFLEEQMDQLCRDLLEEDPVQVEWHASMIRGGKGSLWSGLSRDKREELMEAVYKIIANANTEGFCLFGQVIEKSNVVPRFATLMEQAILAKREAQHRLKSAKGDEKQEAKQAVLQAKNKVADLYQKVLSRGFEGLCTQFEHFLRRFYNPSESEKQQRGILILDHASYENDLQFLMSEYRACGTTITEVRNVIAPPLFASSHSTRMLQIADFISYALFRRYQSKDTGYFDIVAHRFDEIDGIVHGIAHLNSAWNTCMCPGCASRRTARRFASSHDYSTNRM